MSNKKCIANNNALSSSIVLVGQVQERFTAGMPRAVCGEHHSSRSAIATGSRAARTEGESPPMNPIKRANRIPSARRSGVMRKAKAIFENVCQFMVEAV